MTEMQDLEKLVCYVTRFRRGERDRRREKAGEIEKGGGEEEKGRE